MNTKKITVCLLLAMIAILGLWDVFAVSNNVAGDTISSIVLGTAHKYPIIPFILGIVMGHLFWPNKGTA